MIERLGETLWVLDYLDDLEADFLRFYSIEDMYDQESVRFFRLAHRVAVYGGVMANRIETQRERGDDGLSSPDARRVPLESLQEYYD